MLIILLNINLNRNILDKGRVVVRSLVVNYFTNGRSSPSRHNSRPLGGVLCISKFFFCDVNTCKI